MFENMFFYRTPPGAFFLTYLVKERKERGKYERARKQDEITLKESLWRSSKKCLLSQEMTLLIWFRRDGSLRKEKEYFKMIQASDIHALSPTCGDK